MNGTLALYKKGRRIAIVDPDEKIMCYGDLGAGHIPVPCFTKIDDVESVPRYQFKFKPVNEHTEARRTFRGGIVIRRMDDPETTVSFTQEDYKRIVNHNGE